jgi:hypothetical protein
MLEEHEFGELWMFGCYIVSRSYPFGGVFETTRYFGDWEIRFSRSEQPIRVVGQRLSSWWLQVEL